MLELWKPVVGFEGLYEVSSLGNVRSVPRFIAAFSARAGKTVTQRRQGRLLAKHPNVHGYMTVCICSEGAQRTKRVSPLVCEAFNGPRPAGMQACHDNGDRRDDRASNLRWDTPTANQADRVRHGTHKRGENVGTAKITVADVQAILASRSFDSFVGCPVSRTHYYRIKRGESWAHVDAFGAQQGVRFTAPEHMDAA